MVSWPPKQSSSLRCLGPCRSSTPSPCVLITCPSSATSAHRGVACGLCTSATTRFFIFIFFNFVFYKNIFSFSTFTEIYPSCLAAGRPAPGRSAAGRQGLFCKSFRGKFARGTLEDRPPGRPLRPPGSGATSSHKLYIRVGWYPHPSFTSLKFQKKKKREGGRERRGEGEAKWQSSVGFSSRQLQVTKIFYTLQIDYVVIIFVDTVD